MLSFTELNDLYNARMWRYADCLHFYEWQMREAIGDLRRGALVAMPVPANMLHTALAHPEYLDRIEQEFRDADWHVERIIEPRHTQPTFFIQRK